MAVSTVNLKTLRDNDILVSDDVWTGRGLSCQTKY